MVEKNVPVTLELNMQNKFYPENTSSFNIIGEIPGTDPQLKDEVVMIGAHFDSWHSGHRRHRQRRGLRRDARGDAPAEDAQPPAAAHHPHRAVDRRRAGAARLGRVRAPAFRHARHRRLSSDRRAEEVRRVLQRRQRQRQDSRRLPAGHRGRASDLRRVDGAVQGHGDEDAHDQQHGRHGPPVVHRRWPAGLPVHPGSARLRQRHAPHQPGCVRAAAARRHEVQLGGRGELRVAGRAARREAAASARAGSAAGAARAS